MHNLNHTQLKHHAAIGGVALNWTHLENFLQSVLWRIAGMDQRVGRCITQHMPFRSLCDAIITIANETDRFKHLAPELKMLMSQCDALRIKRNDTVHALWAMFIGSSDAEAQVLNAGVGEVTGMLIKARGSLNIKINRTTVSAIDDISEEIIDFSNRLGDFVEKYIPNV